MSMIWRFELEDIYWNNIFAKCFIFIKIFEIKSENNNMAQLIELKWLPNKYYTDYLTHD